MSTAIVDCSHHDAKAIPRGANLNETLGGTPSRFGMGVIFQATPFEDPGHARKVRPASMNFATGIWSLKY